MVTKGRQSRSQDQSWHPLGRLHPRKTSKTLLFLTIFTMSLFAYRTSSGSPFATFWHHFGPKWLPKCPIWSHLGLSFRPEWLPWDHIFSTCDPLAARATKTSLKWCPRPPKYTLSAPKFGISCKSIALNWPHGMRVALRINWLPILLVSWSPVDKGAGGRGRSP